jgi:Cof subfamily protein (haloacid dehalogenase superfamily)
LVTLVFAPDLDGTLLHDDSTLSNRTRRALRLARAAGARVVVATARPARVIDALFGADELDAAVCGNGAVTYEVGSAQVEVAKPLPQDLARWLIAEIHSLVPDLGFAVETGTRALYEPRYRFQPTHDYERYEVAGIADLMVGPLVKVMVYLPHANPHETWELLRPALGSAVDCTWSSPDAPALEISATGVSKADGLAGLCTRWGVRPAAVTAFGDAVNDLPMLRWAGTPYAVANADPRVLAAVTHHTASNNDDGVAAVLERLFALD